MRALRKAEGATAPSDPHVHPTAYIHPLAHVECTARIGARTKIWQFASVVRGAVLGADCSVASSVTIDGARFGDRCVISQGVTTCPGLSFGDDVFLGPNATFCNDRWPSVDKTGFDIAEFDGSKWTIIVQRDASIGAGAVVLPGVVIGRGAMVAAAAVVRYDVPDGHLLTRDGRVLAIDYDRCLPRMRFAQCSKS
jgi:UDP-2-acetamido-3-amino-2,3-dideoxy-glucuronate N-acetyltransferase